MEFRENFDQGQLDLSCLEHPQEEELLKKFLVHYKKSKIKTCHALVRELLNAVSGKNPGLSGFDLLKWFRRSPR